MTNSPPICVRCQQPVTLNRDSYIVFERMHWLCFHLEYEHAADPDAPCNDPSCPWWHIQIFRQALEQLGHNPHAILVQAIEARWMTKPEVLS